MMYDEKSDSYLFDSFEELYKNIPIEEIIELTGLTKEEMENGINNLKKVDYKVDYIISH